MLEERSKMHGFELVKIPVTAPGVEQKSAWLQVRQQRPDYVLLWGWGVMNSDRLEGGPGHRLSAREDVRRLVGPAPSRTSKDVGEGAKGYSALNLNTSGTAPKVIQDILKLVHDKGQGTGPKDEVGSVLYTRGLIIQMLGIEAVRRAQERFGKGKVMTGGAGALGPGEPGVGPEEARRAGLRRHAAPDRHELCRPHGPRPGRACTPGTARSGTSARTGWRPTRRILKPNGQGGGGQVRRRQEDHAAHAGGLPELVFSEVFGTQRYGGTRRPRRKPWAAIEFLCAPPNFSVPLRSQSRGVKQLFLEAHEQHPSQRQRHRGHLQPCESWC